MSTSFYFTQSTPATTWNITHNLDCAPLCDILQLKDGVVSKILPKKITYLSLNEIRVEFSDFTQGYATLFGKYKYDLNTSAGTVDIPHAPTPVPSPPDQNSNNITNLVNNDDGTGTATYTGDLFYPGQYVEIDGATPEDYNGTKFIIGTDTDPNTFTFPLPIGTPAAGGSPNATLVTNPPPTTPLVIVDIVNNGDGTATATYTGGPVYNGQIVTIIGATQPEYNGSWPVNLVTVPIGLTSGSFTYDISGAPTSPATGTISATARWFFDTFSGSAGSIENRIPPDHPDLIWNSDENDVLINGSGKAYKLPTVMSHNYPRADINITPYDGAFDAKIQFSPVPQISFELQSIALNVDLGFGNGFQISAMRAWDDQYSPYVWEDPSIRIRVVRLVGGVEATTYPYHQYAPNMPEAVIDHFIPTTPPAHSSVTARVRVSGGVVTLFVNEVEVGSSTTLLGDITLGVPKLSLVFWGQNHGG